jgi:hypothetical protein
MMRACLSSLVLFFVFGCRGSEPAAESPASAPEPAGDGPSEPGAESTATPGAEKSGDEGGWEGEADAKKASGDGTGKAAPPDTKKEETRTTEVIAKIVKDNRQPVRDCYDKAQKELPSLKGPVHRARPRRVSP